MLSYLQILLFSLAVLVILSLSDKGMATNFISISKGCYTIASKKTCPPEISGYMPVSAGPDDVFYIHLNDITWPGQHTIQQTDDPGKGGKVVDPSQTGQNTGQHPGQNTGGSPLIHTP